MDRNVFVERILPASVLRPLTDEEMGEYRRPFGTPGEGRVPTLIWPRQIPIDGVPADVHEVCAAYAAWLASAPGLPKLFVNAEPGSILTGAVRDFCRTWPDQAEVTVPGIHFIQEDSGAEIGPAIAAWLGQLPEPNRGTRSCLLRANLFLPRSARFWSTVAGCSSWPSRPMKLWSLAAAVSSGHWAHPAAAGSRP